MALPSSGTITIEMIRAEFGGTTPVSISQYYRGGGLVPNVTTNNAVPTSGAISFSNFYGATNTDLVPDPIDWGGLFGSNYFSGYTSDENDNKTISGITDPITISVSVNILVSFAFGTSCAVSVNAIKNNSSIAGVSWTANADGTKVMTSFTVAAGDVLRFFGDLGVSNNQGGFDASGSVTGSVTVTNATTGGVIDTFDISFEASNTGTIG